MVEKTGRYVGTCMYSNYNIDKKERVTCGLPDRATTCVWKHSGCQRKQPDNSSITKVITVL